MKKITIVTDSFHPELGGSYKAVSSHLFQLLKRNIFKIKFVHHNDGNYKRNINIGKILDNTDIVHFFGLWTLIHIKWLILSILKRKKIIITPMGTLEPWSLSQNKLKKKLALFLYQKFFLRKSDIIHCTSDSEEKNIKNLSNIVKTIVIPHGISDKGFQKKKIFYKKKKKIIFFSRIHIKKGLLPLVKAWSVVKPKNWELHIYGPDGDGTKKVLENYIIKNKLTKKVLIKKPIFDLKLRDRIFRNYHAMVLLSFNENFGFSILEGLRFSLPVITTKETPWEIINKFNAGYCINNDFETIKNTLKNFDNINDKQLLRMSKNAYNLSKKYEWKKLINIYCKMYLKIL